MFEFVDKVDHVLAHGRAVDPVNPLSSLRTGVLRLQHTYTHTVNNTKGKSETVYQPFGKRMQNQVKF